MTKQKQHKDANQVPKGVIDFLDKKYSSPAPPKPVKKATPKKAAKK
jgi:hypothetical protein